MDSNYKGDGLDLEYESVHPTLPLSYNLYWFVTPNAPGNGDIGGTLTKRIHP